MLKKCYIVLPRIFKNEIYDKLCLIVIRLIKESNQKTLMFFLRVRNY